MMGMNYYRKNSEFSASLNKAKMVGDSHFSFGNILIRQIKSITKRRMGGINP